MKKQYILNKETQKIELHFTKEEYQALTEEQKKEIKSYYLWSNYGKCWVSRSKNNHYGAIRIAEKLGFVNGGSTGTRKSYKEELEAKAEKAKARAERYEQYSNNAKKRGDNLQADFNKYRKDWSWLTQPIIAGHSGSRAFQNHRNKVIARYERGFKEYSKSDYYKERAVTARATADNVKLTDKIYLHKKIKECNKNLKIYQDHIVKYEEALYKIQQGEQLKNRSGEILTENYIEKVISDRLEKYEYEYEKLEFFENCMNELGGIQFSKNNIKPGYIVNIKGSGKSEVISTGTVNITYKILEGGAAGMCLKIPYAGITEILKVKEIKQEIENPFKINDIFVRYAIASNTIIKAYQVLKTTNKGVTVQEINLDENKKPILNSFKENSKPIRRQITRNKYTGNLRICINDYEFNKYIA